MAYQYDDDDVIGMIDGELGCAIHEIPLNAFGNCPACESEAKYEQWEEDDIEAFKSRSRE